MVSNKKQNSAYSNTDPLAFHGACTISINRGVTVTPHNLAATKSGSLVDNSRNAVQ